MIPGTTTELAIAIARGLIKLGGRLDRLLAEKVATQSGLALKLPAVRFSIGPNRIIIELEKHLASTSEADPGPLGARRKELGQLLNGPEPDPDELRDFYGLLFPAAASVLVDPDEKYLEFLRATLPTVSLEDADTRTAAVYVAAFSVDPGEDKRQLGYPLRLGLLVVDTLAEFGAEHTQLFVRDEGLRSVVQAILGRFAGLELETFDEWSPLLRHALAATLDGALAARGVWKGNNAWLEAVLDALAQAREAAGENGDNYLLGLLRGKGYHLLISQGLAKAAERLDEAQAGAFRQIAAAVLSEAADLVAAKPRGFGPFFKETWADLLHAALVSLDKHGAVLLEGEDPLLRQVLLATIHTLSETSGTRFLARDTLFHVADAAVGALATHPELLAGGLDEPWLATVITSVVKTASDLGIRRTFTQEGLARVLRGAAAMLAEHPDLLVAEPGLFQGVVGGILKQVSALHALDAVTVGTAAVQGALGAIAARPDLLKTKYAAAIADLTGTLAALVKGGAFSAAHAAEIISAAAAAALRNPELYGEASKGTAGLVVNAVVRAAKDDPGNLLNGNAIVAVVRELLLVLARRGRAKVEALADQLEDQLAGVLKAGLARAAQELGTRLDLSTLAPLLAALVGRWLGDQVPVLDPNDSTFQDLFAELADGLGE